MGGALMGSVCFTSLSSNTRVHLPASQSLASWMLLKKLLATAWTSLCGVHLKRASLASLIHLIITGGYLICMLSLINHYHLLLLALIMPYAHVCSSKVACHKPRRVVSHVTPVTLL